MTKRMIVAVIAVVVVSLVVSGCTTTSTPSPTPSQTPPLNAFLAQLIVAYQQEARAGNTTTAWEVRWNNSTTADLAATVQNNTTHDTISIRQQYVWFPSIDAATRYVNAQKDNYSLARTVYTSGAYERATGHPPSVYQDYRKITGDTLLNVTLHRIEQVDNAVVTETTKYVWSGVENPLQIT